MSARGRLFLSALWGRFLFFGPVWLWVCLAFLAALSCSFGGKAGGLALWLVLALLWRCLLIFLPVCL